MFIKIADDFDAAGSEVPVPEPNTCTLKNVEHPMAVAINPDNGNCWLPGLLFNAAILTNRRV